MIFRRERRLRGAASIVVSVAAAVGSAIVVTSSPAAEGPTVAPSSSVAVPRPARPYWIELTVAQRQALAPLADDWERLDLQTKKKWIEIGNRYPNMNPDEQGRTQQRMREWAMLTPDQRRIARDSFARVRAMNPEQRADILRKYHELPAEKQQQLATEGRANKAIVVPKPTTTPVPQRLQIREGAKVRNPALAAQKSASAAGAPAKVEPHPAAAMTPPVAVVPPAVDPSAAPTVAPAVVPVTKPATP